MRGENGNRNFEGCFEGLVGHYKVSGNLCVTSQCIGYWHGYLTLIVIRCHIILFFAIVFMVIMRVYAKSYLIRHCWVRAHQTRQAGFL